jgi:hypothetical protein
MDEGQAPDRIVGFGFCPIVGAQRAVPFFAIKEGGTAILNP